MHQTSYGLRVTLPLSCEAAIARATEALQAEGFGVLTSIDVQETLRRKLDRAFRKYVILGACNPPLADRALHAELEVGLLLPCNVIVYETDEGKTVVSAVDPVQTMAARAEPALRPIAEEVQRKLRRALEAIDA